MTAPSLYVQQPGVGVVSADNFNTYEQTCDNVAQLRSFTGNIGVQVFTRGTTTPGDGGQGVFWWNYTAVSPVDDNGVTTIVPYGAGQGCWTRLTSVILTRAVGEFTPANPAGPQSTSLYTMMGLGSLITPAVTGRILCTFCGFVFNGAVTDAGVGMTWKSYYGTGTAPVNGATLTGIQSSQSQEYSLAAASIADNATNPFSITSLAIGLTLGISYWFDLAAIAIGSTGFVFSDITATLVEV